MGRAGLRTKYRRLRADGGRYHVCLRVHRAVHGMWRPQRRLLLYVRRPRRCAGALQRVRLLLPPQRRDGCELLLKASATLAMAAAIAGCASSASRETDSAAEGGNDVDAYGSDRRADTEAGSADLVVLPAQFTEENMPLRMLADGDPLDLWAAPQGGHVVLLSAKVKHLSTDTATLKVQVRRPDTGLIVAVESRTVAMVAVAGEPDTKQPDLRS